MQTVAVCITDTHIESTLYVDDNPQEDSKFVGPEDIRRFAEYIETVITPNTDILIADYNGDLSTRRFGIEAIVKVARSVARQKQYIAVRRGNLDARIDSVE